MPITQSFTECPFSRTGQRDPRAALFLLRSGACTLLPTWCRRPHLARRLPHSCVCDNGPQCWIPPLQAKARLGAPGGCAVSGLESLVLRAVPLLRATHPPVRRPVSLFAPCVPSCAGGAGLHRLGVRSAVCVPPACLPAPRLPEREPRTAHIPGRTQETSLAPVGPRHRSVSHFAGPWPSASSAWQLPFPGCSRGAWAHIRIPWLGSRLWWWPRGQHTFPPFHASMCFFL